MKQAPIARRQHHPAHTQLSLDALDWQPLTACVSPSYADGPPQGYLVNVQVALPTVHAAPRLIHVDKHATYPKAIADLNTAAILPAHVELRQVKDLNNLIEQVHRFIKRFAQPEMGFFSFATAQPTLQELAVMNRIRNEQVQAVDKGDVKGQVAKPFGMVSHTQQAHALHRSSAWHPYTDGSDICSN